MGLAYSAAAMLAQLGGPAVRKQLRSCGGTVSSSRCGWLCVIKRPLIRAWWVCWVRAFVRGACHVSWCCTCVGLRRDGVGVWRWSETGVVNSIAGAWLGPEACSWQAAPRGVARIVTWWGCGLAVPHRAVFAWVALLSCRNF